jgi:peroxiredoxin (alkyl hydroperoxide reductase subunit C)
MSWVTATELALVLALGGGQQLWAQKAALGPKDGPTDPPSDLDRVKVGDLAPDFTLEALDGRVVTLSSYRGHKNVVLVFYRGHW